MGTIQVIREYMYILARYNLDVASKTHLNKSSVKVVSNNCLRRLLLDLFIHVYKFTCDKISIFDKNNMEDIFLR